MSFVGWFVGITYSVIYWMFVAGQMYAEVADCIPGSDEYPCPTAAQRNAEWLLTAAIGLAAYAAAFVLIRWLAKKLRPPISN